MGSFGGTPQPIAINGSFGTGDKIPGGLNVVKSTATTKGLASFSGPQFRVVAAHKIHSAVQIPMVTQGLSGETIAAIR
ncbi:MAG: hypothetical protein ACRD30_06120 [Bryobacteraceae bacterium]